MSTFSIDSILLLSTEFASLRVALANRDYPAAVECLQQAFNSLMEQERYQDALTLHDTILQSLPRTSEVTELRLWCLLGVGNASFNMGQDAAAETAYTRMREEAQETGDTYLHAVALAHLGDLARKRGQVDMAEQYYQESIESRVEIGDYFGTVETLLFLAMSREQSQQLARARQALTAVGEILKSLRRTLFQTHVPDYEQTYQHWEMALWFQQASLLRAEGDLLGAARTFRKALKAARLRHDAVAEAKLLQNLANNEVEQGRTTKALPLYESSLAIAQENGLRQTVGEVHLGLAIALFQLKRYEESLTFYELVRAVAKESDDQDLWASFTADAGAVCLEAGWPERARELLDEALRHFGDRGNVAWQERIIRNLLVMDARQDDMEALQSHLHECLNLMPQSAFALRGSLYHQVGNLCLNIMGDPSGATRYFRQESEEASAGGDVFQAGYTAALAAAALSEAGAFQDALVLFDRATDIFARIGDIANLWRTRNDRGNVFARLEEYEEAVEEYAWCLQTASERQDQVLEAQVLLNYGEVKRRIGETEEALFYMERALGLYRAMEDREGEMDALNGMGLCLLELPHDKNPGRSQEASEHFERALELAKYRKDLSGEAMATRGLANIAERQGNITTALRLFLRAANLWEREGDFAHSAEALASRVTLQVVQFDPRRWQKDTDRLVQLAIQAGRIGTASRAFAGAAGHLMQAGLWEAAASVALLAISMHQYRYPAARTAQDEQVVEQEAANDLDNILVYLTEGMNLWLTPEDSARFLEHLTKAENFASPTDATDLRDSIEAIRKELVAQEPFEEA